MKNKIKKWHIALMSFMALFIAIFASLFSLRADTVDEETGEVLTDNWELGLVFYDSTVDNGKTPLTEINWDASDGDYLNGEPRVITVQINYKNNSAVTTYQPGELQISIDSLLKGAFVSNSNSTSFYLKQLITVGANDSTHIGYDWNYITILDKDNTNHSFCKKEIGSFIFTNANVIEEKSNFEGSIQIAYTITPLKNEGDAQTKYFNEHTYNYANTLKATLNNSITSNEIEFDYTRTYYHSRIKTLYTLEKTASKIKSFDGLGNNASDYIWVKYIFTIQDGFYNQQYYPYVNAKNLHVKDEFPEECIVINSFLEKMESENNIYTFSTNENNKIMNTSNRYKIEIYVGYPKLIYNNNTNNLNITNYAELYVDYEDNTLNVYQDNAEVSINLADFEFTYTGELYGVNKKLSSTAYYESISGLDPQLDNSFFTKLQATAIYTDNEMDVKIGDDLLYIIDSQNAYRKLSEDEYYFSYISFPLCLYNGHGEKIPEGKYTCELWVKYKNSNDYQLYSTFTNTKPTVSTGNKKWEFTENQHVTGFYFIIKNLKESIVAQSKYQYTYDYDYFESTIKIINATDIKEEGTVYNFAYLQVYKENVLQNAPTIDSYANFITKEEIATFDQETYGTYMQRSFDNVNYYKYKVPTPRHEMSISKSLGTVTQDIEAEQFLGTATLSLEIDDNKITPHVANTYISQIDTNYKCIGFEMYDLLPEGMVLTSNSQDIIDLFYTSYSPYEGTENWVGIYNNTKCLSKNELYDLIKNNLTSTIINNYNNTNRTLLYIKCAFEETPLLFISKGYSMHTLTFKYNYAISYDSLLEYGSVWTNRFYCNPYNRTLGSGNHQFYAPSYSMVLDNGTKDIEEKDINNNSNINENLLYSTSSTTITSVISTNQDITTYVQTDINNYSTGIADASCGSEYEYKLRVRTGSADVTNLVIYTVIEEAQPKRTRWYGEFMGVDTTYAENKGYTVKVWYSPNKTVGTLVEDTSWQVYDEATVDKSIVKSLAFQYLVETDDTTSINTDAIDPAVLPANSLTYVLIKMKAPNDESETRLARMDCWTQWNAIDEFDQPVDFITGINSNVVKVALPNSIKTDDLPSISLKFTKEITGSESAFEKMSLNKADEELFMIRLTSLTANDDGTYNQVIGLLSSTQGLVITQIPIGTYLLEELGDNYFDFVDFTDNNDPEIVINGVTFERTDQGYIITVSEDLSETVEFNIKVTNEIEDERFYEDKEYKENLFLVDEEDDEDNGMMGDEPEGQ